MPPPRTSAPDDDLKDLAGYLSEINGQDAYDTLAVAVGKLPCDQYLQLIEAPKAVDAKEVGGTRAWQRMSSTDILRIAVLNAEICRASDAVPRYTFGLLRACAVAWGWTPNAKEVTYVSRADADRLWQEKKGGLIAWMKDNTTTVTNIRGAAFLLPFCARHVFHTTGHHYLSHDAAAYKEKYDTLFRSMLMENLGDLLPRDLLHHTALHWISPGTVSATLTLAATDPEVRARIPNSLYLRRAAPPAGTAVITTSAATLKAMTAPGILPVLTGIYADAMQLVFVQDAKIRANPERYHQTHQAYGLPPLAAELSEEMEAAREAATTLAPICQAFINAYIGHGSLSRAQALKKAAESSPLLLRILEQWFRAFAKSQKTRDSLEALLYSKPRATAGALEEAGDEMPAALKS